MSLINGIDQQRRASRAHFLLDCNTEKSEVELIQVEKLTLASNLS